MASNLWDVDVLMKIGADYSSGNGFSYSMLTYWFNYQVSPLSVYICRVYQI